MGQSDRALVSVARFSKLARISVAIRQRSRRDSFFRPKIPAILLIGTTIFWFYRYKAAVIKELSQINEIFEEEHAPKYFGNIEGYRLIPIVGYVLVGTYCALVLAAPHISIYCLIALILHATDLTGSALTLQNLHRTLVRFPVMPKTPAAKFVAERRDAITQYYFGNLTLPRIGILTFATAGALTLSLTLPTSAPELVRYIPYVLMIANILLGEYVIGRWRAERDCKLDEISIREDANAIPNASQNPIVLVLIIELACPLEKHGLTMPRTIFILLAAL